MHTAHYLEYNRGIMETVTVTDSIPADTATVTTATQTTTDAATHTTAHTTAAAHSATSSAAVGTFLSCAVITTALFFAI